MTKFLFPALLAALLAPQAAQAALVVGWDTFTNPDGGAIAAPHTATGFSGSLLTNDPVWGQTTSGGLAGNTYGTLVFTNAGGSHLSLNTGGEGFVDFTVTNSSGDDYDLDFFRFDAGTTRPGAADAWTLSIQSGALPAGTIASGVNPVTPGGSATALWTDYDIPLSGTLADGDSVVFRLDFAKDSNQGPGGHHQYVDNIAVSGVVTAVPEPSSLALLGLCASGIIARRRCK